MIHTKCSLSLFVISIVIALISLTSCKKNNGDWVQGPGNYRPEPIVSDSITVLQLEPSIYIYKEVDTADINFIIWYVMHLKDGNIIGYVDPSFYPHRMEKFTVNYVGELPLIDTTGEMEIVGEHDAYLPLNPKLKRKPAFTILDKSRNRIQLLYFSDSAKILAWDLDTSLNGSVVANRFNKCLERSQNRLYYRFP
ncbi:MAG TPA: hypothetical protein VJU78_07830 [Chitinophagaceae bacterium]|nr:hypothetical protein [Chitinophagaceae bacterium]